MALITDPDVLSGNALQVDTVTKTLLLSACESLSTDGVTIKCVYSKLKELWKSEASYIPYAFPMGPITDEQFEMINEWDWAGDSTRYLLRTGGWAKKNATGISEQEYAGIISLGSLNAGAQVYFQQGPATEAGSAAVNFQLTNAVNQAVCVYSSGGTPGVYDYRDYMRLFVREWGYSYDEVDLTDIGVTTMAYQAYRFPLSNTADPKITLAMSALSAAPYTDILVTWYAAAQSKTIGPSADDYHVIITGDSQNAEDIYQRIQYLLKEDADIDTGAGLVVGKTAPSLLRFVGDTMYTEFFTITPTGGTYIDAFQGDDINRLVFVTDNPDLSRTYPYTAVLTLNFGDNLVADGESKYWVYFTDTPTADYGTSNALLVRTTTTVATCAVARTLTTVSLTAADAHGLSAEDCVEVTGITALASGYEGQWVVASTPSNYIFTYESTVSSSEAYASDETGDVYKLMSELVRGNTSLQRSYDYDQNVQGDRTPATQAAITCVSLGLTGAQFVKATGTIERSISNAVSLVSALERNYQNV